MVKTNQKFNVSRGPSSWLPYFGQLAQNKSSHELRHYGLLGVLNTLLAFSHPRRKDYIINPMFLSISFIKFICAYWAKNVTVLTIWVSMLFTVFTISLDFLFKDIFLRRFLLELFIMLHVKFLTSEIKFETYKIATVKMYIFWGTIATCS